MHSMRASVRGLCLLLALALVAGVVACSPAWQFTLRRPDGGAMQVNAAAYRALNDLVEDVDGQKGVPLERLLVEAGHSAVEHITVVEAGGAEHTLPWAEVAAQAWLLGNGRLRVGAEELQAARIEVQPLARLGAVEARLIDVAPTIAAALGVPAPAQATGQALAAPAAQQAALIFLDGFGAVRFDEALQQGLVPHLAALGTPLLGLATYPPITPVSTASLLTGAPPSVHGVNRRGIRNSEVQTLFDAVQAAGRSVTAVEGDSLAFALRSAEIQLSGDRDGNGSTDDNVLANALAVLQEGMPDLLFVHWHGIDDAGHTYGPGAPEEIEAIRQVDVAVGQVIEALPKGTLIVVVADHGMHAVQEEGRLGNHGHLIERDIFVPIWITVK